MAASRPANVSNWVRTNWTADAIDALHAPRLFTDRIDDVSDEVTGEAMQVLNIPIVEESTDAAVGDDGEVTDQVINANNATLTIDQYRAAAHLFRDDYRFQVVLKEGVQAKEDGEALRTRMEEYGLSLETGINAAGVRNIAGSLVDSELLNMAAFAVTNDWPTQNRHWIVSANQMTQIISDERHSNTQFTGDGNLVVRTGKMPLCYTFEMLTSSLVRRRDVSGTTRTINMAWIGKRGKGRGAFVKGVQQGIQVKFIEEGLARRSITSTLYGISLIRGGATKPLVRAMRTTDS